MKEIFIRNIFVDIFLTYYFKYAFNISYAVMQQNGKNNFIDERSLSRITNSIYQKILSVNVHKSRNCSFLNLSSVLNLPTKQVYPVKFTLTAEELFWFEFIINIPANQLFKYCDDSKNIRELRRLYSIPDSYKEEVISIFNNTRAMELIRVRFVHGERIGNEPARVGFYIDSKTGVAYRL